MGFVTFHQKRGNCARLLFVFLIFTSFVVKASPPIEKITISVSNVSLETVFKNIQRQSSFRFIYTSESLEGTLPVSISIKNADIAKVLQMCFANQPVDYSIEDRFITVRRKTAASQDKINVIGIVLNESGDPIPGVLVSAESTRLATITATDGKFELDNISGNAILHFSGVNVESLDEKVSNRTNLVIKLKYKVAGLQDVSITVSNGYQEIPKDRATGSFDLIDHTLINRSVSTDIISRIENLTPGILFNHGDAAGTDQILIRGRSTIYANAAPLIVLDNFPYDGDLYNINPNDIETISILKDAAAASIWGARAGNGVIVITTKKGRTANLRIEFNTNFTFQQKPDLFNVNTISSSDFIDLERYLYNQGFYDVNFQYLPLYHPAVTPVVNLLNQVDNGLVSPDIANQKIETMKSHDVRNDISKYMYRTSIFQQYALNVSGLSPNLNYYMSLGWDHNLQNLVGSKGDRVTFRSQNTFNVSRDLQISAGLSYISFTNESGNNPGYQIAGSENIYPYASLVDSKGNPLPVYLDNNAGYVQQAQQAGLLNWQYSPVTDINNTTNESKTRDFLFNAGVQYTITKPLRLEIKYQFENQLVNGSSFYSDSSYFARNLLNEYTQVASDGTLTFPIPRGGIIDLSNSEVISHQGRAQLDFNKIWEGKNEITAIAGCEIRSIVTTGNTNRQYGYDPDISNVNPNIDYTTIYNFYQSYNSGKIPSISQISEMTDHFLSYYANASYVYKGKYILSASGRKDEANLFGVSTNEKGTPLWSAGANWIISEENFYKLDWLPLLKLKLTYGYNGNISRQATAYTTIEYNTANYSPAVDAAVQNPPNAKLRWERVGMVNLGFDFESRNKIISGTIEYYFKKDRDLMGSSPLDPTYGFIGGLYTGSSFFGNVASMDGKGIDVQLKANIFRSKFRWSNTFIFSYVNTKVTQYLLPESSTGSIYLSPGYINPIVGRPLFGMYSYKWGGLDHNTGDPVGYLNGKMSTDWANIISTTSLDSMVYNGPATPPYFGAFRSNFGYKSLNLSVNISYKFGYYFRKPSINYTQLFSTWTGSGDYARRWQKPGDEETTNVPSLDYPADANRDIFYSDAQVLVEKADNIRLEDIRLSYDIDKQQLKRLPFEHVEFYVYASNLAVLWTANKGHIDPYYNNVPKDGKRISVGLNLIF